jgi:CNT family concentrative nucleoside transporter
MLDQIVETVDQYLGIPHRRQRSRDIPERSILAIENVTTQLVANQPRLVSLVALVNAMIAAFVVGGEALTLQRMMGWAFAPVAWLIGIPWAESTQGGALLGTKLVLNELVAYIQLAAVPATDLSAHSRLILTYALCGFANLGSLGISLGGIGALVPERRSELFELAPRTLISATIVNCITGAIVGLVYAPPG